ncbi:Prophage endopeptidase tail [anaerobic digester metagenome]
MIYLFDRHLQLTETVRNPISAIMSRRLIGVDRLQVEAGIETYEQLKGCYYAGHFFDDRFYIYTIKRLQARGSTVGFEGINYAHDELANISIIEDKRPQDVSAAEAILSAMEGTGWSVGTVESTPLLSTNFYYVSPLQALQKVIEVWGIEPDLYFEFDGKKITGRKIDVLQRRGRLTGERYVYGSNVMEILQEEDRSSIVTAIVGRGKGIEILDEEGKPTGGYGRRIDFADVVWSKAAGDPVDKPAGQLYVEIPEMTALYGYPKPDGTLSPRIEVFIDDQQTDTTELLWSSYRVVIDRARPLVTFESTVARTGPYQLGDTNYIIRPNLGIYYEARIFEDEVDLLNPSLTKFKFGDYIPSGQAQRTKELKKQFEGLSDKISSVEKSTMGQILKVSKDWYDALMESKSDTFFDGASFDYSLKADNPYGLPAGIYSFDAPLDDDAGTPEPTSAVVLRNGKIGRANILPDGSWDFNLIGDGSGLTADAITAGKIKAQFIEIGPSSTFLEGYDPSMKANANQVYTKTEMDTKFTVLDGLISSKIVTEVTEQIGEIGIYKVDLISTNGLVFKNDNVSTTLIARVYKNNVDVTDQINASRFRWTKTNEDGSPDEAWNTRYFGGAKQVTLTAEDVNQRASFKCEILEE